MVLHELALKWWNDPRFCWSSWPSASTCISRRRVPWWHPDYRLVLIYPWATWWLISSELNNQAVEPLFIFAKSTSLSAMLDIGNCICTPSWKPSFIRFWSEAKDVSKSLPTVQYNQTKKHFFVFIKFHYTSPIWNNNHPRLASLWFQFSQWIVTVLQNSCWYFNRQGRCRSQLWLLFNLTLCAVLWTTDMSKNWYDAPHLLLSSIFDLAFYELAWLWSLIYDKSLTVSALLPPLRSGRQTSRFVNIN